MSEEHVTEQGEEWKAVVRWEGLYEVSTFGRVRSVERIVTRWLKKQARYGKPKFVPACILKTPPTPAGYPHLNLARDAKRIASYVHVLVLEAFVGPCPEGLECRHLDGNPGNSHLSNLCWGTHLENMADQKAHGMTAKGEKSVFAKLRDADIPVIRQRCRSGEPCSAIGADYKVYRQTVSRIASGETWSFIP